MNVATLAALLRETSERHDLFEKSHDPHNWWDWYAAYMQAREAGHTPDEASSLATRYLEDDLHVSALPPSG